MCPRDDAHNTIEFDDHFVIAPSFNFYDKKRDYLRNSLNEKGKLVDKNFEYNSGNNEHFLNHQEILEMDNKA